MSTLSLYFHSHWFPKSIFKAGRRFTFNASLVLPTQRMIACTCMLVLSSLRDAISPHSFHLAGSLPTTTEPRHTKISSLLDQGSPKQPFHQNDRDRSD